MVMETEVYIPLILVAEDDDSNFKLIKVIIGKKCDVIWAKNGVEVVALFKENRSNIGAILMDVKMPEMNGFDATVAIRELDKEIPIIMQTAYAFDSDRVKALDCGANEVLVKPIMSTMLKKTLSGFLPKLEW